MTLDWLGLSKALVILGLGIGSLVYMAGGFDELETAVTGLTWGDGLLGIMVFRAIFGILIMVYLASLSALIWLAVKR